MHADPLIRFEALWKIYPVGPGVAALRGIDLRIDVGEYVAIMGPSGSGKSTMLNLLGCLDRPTRGRYQLGDRDVSVLSDAELSEIRNLRIGFVFQSFNLIAGLSILANIEVPLFYRGVPRRQRHPRSLELAEMVGLGDRVHHRPSELSGGQQQRVAVARALANDPLLLVADEPTGNLDSQTAADLLDLLDALHARGRSLVVVTHEDIVARRAERVLRLRDGAIESDTRRRAARGPGA
jgi:putative ABC transport system ATP-binding protein